MKIFPIMKNCRFFAINYYEFVELDQTKIVINGAGYKVIPLLIEF